MNKLSIIFVFIFCLVACNKKSHIKAVINDETNGYIQKVANPDYEVIVQYQPPEYKADQEIIVNQSAESKKELMNEFDQLQQFVIRYKFTNNTKMEYADLFTSFKLFANDTIPCIDAHQIPYSPGAPYYEIIALFPVSEKQLGTSFKFFLNQFPLTSSNHEINFDLKK